MRIVVCVKSVPGSTEVKMDPKTNTIVRDGSQAVVNPFDASAFEVALALKDAAAGEASAPAAGCAVDAVVPVEAHGDDAAPGEGGSVLAGDGSGAGSDEPAVGPLADPVHVTALSMGIPDTVRLLRDCIARGADDALLLSDRAFAGADTLATSYALTCGVRALFAGDTLPDLILCGKMAVDGDTAQIGPELAGALDMPCVTDVREVVSCTGRSATVRYGSDEGLVTAEVTLPAVLTVAREVAQLRMPSIAGVRAAEDAEVRVLTAPEAGADTSRTGLAGSPTQVVRSFVPERASEAERIEGSAEEQASALVELVEGMGL